MSDSHGGFDDHGGPNHKARILLISQGFARQLDGPGNKSYLTSISAATENVGFRVVCYQIWRSSRPFMGCKHRAWDLVRSDRVERNVVWDVLRNQRL